MLERIHALLKEKEFTLLDAIQYKNNNTSFKVQCKNGHIFPTSYKKLRLYGCRKCKNKAVKELDEVREMFSNKNLILLSETYKNAHMSLEVQCRICQHIYKDKYYKVCVQKISCPECRKRSIKNEHLRKNMANIKKEIEATGYSLIPITYKNNKQPLQLICDKGHACKLAWNCWTNNHRCPTCNEENRLNKRKQATIDFLKQIGYTVLKFTGTTIQKSTLQIQCPNGHISERKWIYLYYLKRFCTKCKINQPEQEIYTFLKNDIGILNIKQRDRTVLNGKELDIYLPDYKLGIEYHGIYWHCDLFKNPEDHAIKQRLCENKKIRLLTFWQDEWRDEKDKCKDIIRSHLFKTNKLTKYNKDYVVINKRHEDIFEYLDNGFVEKETIVGFKWTDLYRTFDENSENVDGKKFYKIYDNGIATLIKLKQ
jgi:very-short-patch-repair endonuclease